MKKVEYTFLFLFHDRGYSFRGQGPEGNPEDETVAL